MRTKRDAATLTGALALAASLVLSACDQTPPPPPPKGAVPVGVVTVETQKISVTSELPGRTMPFKIAEVRPQINGIVLQRLFREGADVKAGETLYQIDPAVYRAVLDSAEAAPAQTFTPHYPSSAGQEGFEHSPITSTPLSESQRVTW